jgi:hypothetical protein
MPTIGRCGAILSISVVIAFGHGKSSRDMGSKEIFKPFGTY